MTETSIYIESDEWPGQKKLEELNTTELVQLSIAQRTGDRDGVLRIINKLIENEGQRILKPKKKEGIHQLDK